MTSTPDDTRLSTFGGWTEEPGDHPTAAVAQDRYADRGLLGKGGMGEVRRVWDHVLQVELAMKVLAWRVVDSDEHRARFAAEARLTAGLAHPAIVAVQDLGVLDDGRLWFTMDLVDGRTLGEVSRAVRASDGPTADGWTRRRLIGAVQRVAEAVAYAHARGVIHRDLKPSNVMVGAFGEIRVMDWGIARHLGDLTPHPPPVDGEAVDSFGGTQDGRVLGTPGYMAPEQAQGALELLGPPTDVFALGAMLYAVLVGAAPYPSGRPGVVATAFGPHPDVADVDAPEALRAILRRALAVDPADRFPDAGGFATALREWLEGARLRDASLERVARAAAMRPHADALHAEVATLEARATTLAESVPLWAALDDKRPLWDLEGAAAAKRREARLLEAELLEVARSALELQPDLPEAHALLADLYQSRLATAERAVDPAARERADEYELLLRRHDRAGRHTAWLRGDGAVSVVTDPPGATVQAFRYVERDRQRVPEPIGELGQTPLDRVVLPRGSYLLRLSIPGRETVDYPVSIDRLEHWDGVPPGASTPAPVHLPATAVPGAAFVPAGWYRSGGDPMALDSLPERRLWVDALWVQIHPVTIAEFCAFLNDIHPVAAAAAAPPLDLDGGTWRPPEGAAGDQPVTTVTLLAARAYAAWWSTRTGRVWRLPHSLEWEKAARGVDGRAFPWGDHLDPVFCNMSKSARGQPLRAAVTAFPRDVGPFGVRGAGGNVRDWCDDGYTKEAPADRSRVVPAPVGEGAPWAIVRGGCIAAAVNTCRCAARTVWSPTEEYRYLGFRLVSPVP